MARPSRGRSRDWKDCLRLSWDKRAGLYTARSGSYQLVVIHSLVPSSCWRWHIGVKFGAAALRFGSTIEGCEDARNAAEMALDELLEQDEERSARVHIPTACLTIDASNRPMQPTQRIYFDGCEGSGKTTLARVTARRYGLPLLTEVASGVLYEFQQREGERAQTWDRIRADVDLSSDVQARVFERQLADELAHPPPAVYDRTLSCLAYSELYADNFADLLARVPTEYIENLRQSIVFLVRPQRALLGASDGVRAVVAWEAQVRVDQTIETLLRMWRVDFVSVETLTAASRRQQVDWCLQSRGFRKVSK